jgi:putative ABC transport system substrate-binding protein
MSDQDQASIAAFRRTLDGLGWREGRNVQFEIRLAAGNIDQARGYAAELVAMTPDAVLANNTQMVQLLQEKTHSIPIVFVQVPDPVGSGIVASFAHPAGNATGFTNFDLSMGGKWLELLKEVRPGLARVAVILQAGNPTAPEYLKMIEAAAPSLAIQLSATNLRDGPGIDATINKFAEEPDGALLVPPSALATVYSDRIVALSARRRLPAMGAYREFATAGGLMSYGYDRFILFQQAAAYMDRILRGDKPSDLPVQALTKFELVINLKTAKALGLTVPPSVLARADEVIE